MFKKAGLVVCGILAGLLFVEAGLRCAGAIYLAEQDRHNRRETAHAGSYRILCLGESTTFGQYPRLLSRILSEQAGPGTFSVIDRGVPGISSTDIVERLPMLLDEYKPDMVVTMMGINDFPMDGKHVHLWRFLMSLRVYKLYVWLTQRHPAGCYLKSFLYEKADRSLELSLGTKPSTAELYCLRGEICLELGQRVRAENFFNAALSLDPDSRAAKLGLGEICKDRGDLDAAEQLFGEVLGECRDPLECSRACTALSVLYRIRDVPEKVETYLKKAIVYRPSAAMPRKELGWYYYNHERIEDAGEQFSAAVSLDPSDPQGYEGLAAVYERTGRTALAESLYLQMVRANPRSDIMCLMLAAFLRAHGKADAAEYYSRKARHIQMCGFNPVTAANYRRVKRTLGVRGITYVCMQYPLRSAAALKNLFGGETGCVIFVENVDLFRRVLAREPFASCFTDAFAGDFGHCTEKGNELIAANLAQVILQSSGRGEDSR